MLGVLFAFFAAIAPYIAQLGVAVGKLARYAFFALFAALVLRSFGLLPRSPFFLLRSAVGEFPAEWLRVALIFVPVTEMLVILNAWAAAMLLWYVFKMLFSIFRPS